VENYNVIVGCELRIELDGISPRSSSCKEGGDGVLRGGVGRTTVTLDKRQSHGRHDMLTTPPAARACI
jgi:hypothetical protein